MNRPQNEFIWVRTYKDKAELEAKTKEFQAAVAAAGVKLGGSVAKMECAKSNRRLHRSVRPQCEVRNDVQFVTPAGRIARLERD